MTTTEQTDATHNPSTADNSMDDQPYKDRYVTIPNLICLVRVIGSIGLIGLAFNDYPRLFVSGFIFLSLSDWVDGKLARWLNQRSDFGARLDSASDSILYACLLVGSLILKWDVLQHEAAWISLGLGSYLLTSGYGLYKYGRIPSYHTYAAKTTQWLVLFGAVAMLLDVSIWPLRIAVLAGILTNLEATAMTHMLPEWTADVLSIAHARERLVNRDDSQQDSQLSP